MDINFGFIFLSQKQIAYMLHISKSSASRIVQNIRICKNLKRKNISLAELCEYESLDPHEAYKVLQKFYPAINQ